MRSFPALALAAVIGAAFLQGPRPDIHDQEITQHQRWKGMTDRDRAAEVIQKHHDQGLAPQPVIPLIRPTEDEPK